MECSIQRTPRWRRAGGAGGDICLSCQPPGSLSGQNVPVSLCQHRKGSWARGSQKKGLASSVLWEKALTGCRRVAQASVRGEAAVTTNGVGVTCRPHTEK